MCVIFTYTSCRICGGISFLYVCICCNKVRDSDLWETVLVRICERYYSLFYFWYETWLWLYASLGFWFRVSKLLLDYTPKLISNQWNDFTILIMRQHWGAVISKMILLSICIAINPKWNSKLRFLLHSENLAASHYQLGWVQAWTWVKFYSVLKSELRIFDTIPN